MVNTSFAPMLNPEESIIQSIEKHIQSDGGSFEKWFVGLASDVKKDLFDINNISEMNGQWIYNTAENHNIAQSIKKRLIELGAKDTKIGDDNVDANIIFAYKK